jgi:hypothetical protein
MGEREHIANLIAEAIYSLDDDAPDCEEMAAAALAALESAGFVIVKREADQHQIDAAYAQCGMDGPDLALMYRIMVQAAQEQKP